MRLSPGDVKRGGFTTVGVVSPDFPKIESDVIPKYFRAARMRVRPPIPNLRDGERRGRPHDRLC